MPNYDQIKQPEKNTPEYYLAKAKELYGEKSREYFKIESKLETLERLADFLSDNKI